MLASNLISTQVNSSPGNGTVDAGASQIVSLLDNGPDKDEATPMEVD